MPFQFPKYIETYKTIIHIHTQFSFDSLGKPSDIKKAMEVNEIDFVFVTDHNNDNYKFFENGKVFAGVELNTNDGRVLHIGNKIKAISHPNNFEFEHYRWKGEFSRNYVYELVNVKDAVVWSKTLSILTLLKNILILPITKNIYHKWNSLVPLFKWSHIYFSRARGLRIFGGLDHHIKFAYQEHTHGILIPSYISGFKWVQNVIYSFKPLTVKDDILDAIKRGNLHISINGFEATFWANKENELYLTGDVIEGRCYLNCDVKSKKQTIKILKHENEPVLITEKKHFSYLVRECGFYHFEIYEYDFKIGNIYFGFRPVCITNPFEVVNVGEKEIYT